ncbi:hypothetical protein [Marimonas arenosa]|uniref:Uncharacterized protein n=1 Tax=Marimonas arenosa TaxID=1795305 RepID=A0AAE3WCT2_9RHOB|nr:hypothetical protein [Marimonas arenosa]MDQ2089305.1 hypothetical protein [Marimonas arenosa]
MINDLLMSFFFGMPAIVAVLTARNLKNPMPRAIIFWGGLIAVVCVAMVVVPMVACDGHLMKPYKSCIGGDGIASLFNRMAPAILGAAKLYILVGIPLAVLAYVIELVQNRSARTA